jgi:hypothetical protein
VSVSQRKTFPVPLNVVKTDINCSTWTKYCYLICGKFKEQQVHPNSLSEKYCELSDNLCPCLKIGNKSFANVTEIEDLRMTGTVQNCVHKEISNIRFWNWYHAVQNILFSFSLFRNMKIKIYGTVISHVLCDCAALFLTLREEHCLRVCENRVFGAVCGRIRKVMDSVISLNFCWDVMTLRTKISANNLIVHFSCSSNFCFWTVLAGSCFY